VVLLSLHHRRWSAFSLDDASRASKTASRVSPRLRGARGRGEPDRQRQLHVFLLVSESMTANVCPPPVIVAEAFF